MRAESVSTTSQTEPASRRCCWAVRPQTWWQFHKVMPAPASHFRVVAVDLRGMGGSDKPADAADIEMSAPEVPRVSPEVPTLAP